MRRATAWDGPLSFASSAQRVAPPSVATAPPGAFQAPGLSRRPLAYSGSPQPVDIAMISGSFPSSTAPPRPVFRNVPMASQMPKDSSPWSPIPASRLLPEPPASPQTLGMVPPPTVPTRPQPPSAEELYEETEWLMLKQEVEKILKESTQNSSHMKTCHLCGSPFDGDPLIDNREAATGRLRRALEVVWSRASAFARECQLWSAEVRHNTAEAADLMDFMEHVQFEYMAQVEKRVHNMQIVNARQVKQLEDEVCVRRAAIPEMLRPPPRLTDPMLTSALPTSMVPPMVEPAAATPWPPPLSPLMDATKSLGLPVHGSTPGSPPLAALAAVPLPAIMAAQLVSPVQPCREPRSPVNGSGFNILAAGLHNNVGAGESTMPKSVQASMPNSMEIANFVASQAAPSTSTFRWEEAFTASDAASPKKNLSAALSAPDVYPSKDASAVGSKVDETAPDVSEPRAASPSLGASRQGLHADSPTRAVVPTIHGMGVLSSPQSPTRDVQRLPVAMRAEGCEPPSIEDVWRNAALANKQEQVVLQDEKERREALDVQLASQASSPVLQLRLGLGLGRQAPSELIAMSNNVRRNTTSMPSSLETKPGGSSLSHPTTSSVSSTAVPPIAISRNSEELFARVSSALARVANQRPPSRLAPSSQAVQNTPTPTALTQTALDAMSVPNDLQVEQLDALGPPTTAYPLSPQQTDSGLQALVGGVACMQDFSARALSESSGHNLEQPPLVASKLARPAPKVTRSSNAKASKADRAEPKESSNRSVPKEISNNRSPPRPFLKKGTRNGVAAVAAPSQQQVRGSAPEPRRSRSSAGNATSETRRLRSISPQPSKLQASGTSATDAPGHRTKIALA